MLTGVQRRLRVGLIGLVAAGGGAWLRLNARELAWPREFSYSGSRADTIWGVQERAYGDIGLVLLCFGLALLVGLALHWLWSPGE